MLDAQYTQILFTSIFRCSVVCGGCSFFSVLPLYGQIFVLAVPNTTVVVLVTFDVVFRIVGFTFLKVQVHGRTFATKAYFRVGNAFHRECVPFGKNLVYDKNFTYFFYFAVKNV